MMEGTALITLCGFALSAATFFLGRMTSAKTSGRADGEMKADIKYIKATQAELKEDIRAYGIN